MQKKTSMFIIFGFFAILNVTLFQNCAPTGSSGGDGGTSATNAADAVYDPSIFSSYPTFGPEPDLTSSGYSSYADTWSSCEVTTSGVCTQWASRIFKSGTHAFVRLQTWQVGSSSTPDVPYPTSCRVLESGFFKFVDESPAEATADPTHPFFHAVYQILSAELLFPSDSMSACQAYMAKIQNTIKSSKYILTDEALIPSPSDTLTIGSLTFSRD